MRVTYDLTIPAEEKKKFKHALKMLGLTYEQSVTVNSTDGNNVIHYIVKLAKYEFLYMRLAVTVINAVNVDEWNNENVK